MSNEYKPTYVDNTDNSISIMESTDTISFCKTGTKINTLSAKNVAHKKAGENLNLCAFDGSSFNPVITINNNNQDCRIMTNLNVSGNLNINNNLIIPTHSETSNLLANVKGSIYYNTSENMYEGYSQTEGWQPLGGFSKTKDATIHKNLNVIGNINLTNEGMIKTTGIGSFGSITATGSINTSSYINCQSITTNNDVVINNGSAESRLLLGTNSFSGNGSLVVYNPSGAGLVIFSPTQGQANKISLRGTSNTGSDEARITFDPGIVETYLRFQYADKYFFDKQLIIDTTGAELSNGTNTYTLPSSSGTLALTIQIPSNNNQLTNGAGFITASSTDTLTNKSISYSQITGTPSAYTLPTNLTNYNSRMTTTLTDTIAWTLPAGYLRGFYFKILGDLLAINQMYVRVSQVNMQAPAFTPTSDDRLKINEELITNATNTLLKLRPQIYDKKKSLTNTETNKEAGLIVQEIYYEVPELRYLITIPNDASLIDDNKYRNFDDIRNDPDYSNWGHEEAYLNYNGFIPYLIKGFQEQQKEIDTLKTESQQQQTEITILKTENQQQQTEITTLKTESQQQQTKINTLETEVSTLKTENAELKSIINKLKTANSFEEFKQTF